MPSIVVRCQAQNKSGKAPLYVYYSHQSKRFAIPTSYSINPTDLDTAKNAMKKNAQDASAINETIKEIEARIFSILTANPTLNPTASWMSESYNKLILQEKVAEALVTEKMEKIREAQKQAVKRIQKPSSDSKLKAFKELYARYMDARKNEVRTGTYKQYKTFHQNFLELFPHSAQYREMARRYNLSFRVEDMTTEFHQAFLQWGREERNWYDNYCGNQTKWLIAFLHYCEDVLELPVCKQFHTFKKQREKLDIIYLTKEELDLIYAYREQASDSAKRVIDLLLLGNLTGLRISDLLVDFKGKVKKVKDKKYLTDETQKTKGTFFIPFALDDRLEEILERYNYNMKLMTDVHFNRSVKEVLAEVFAFHNINGEEIEVYRSVKGKKILVEKGTKASLYTSHDNRRGMITRLYRDYNLQKETILEILGGKQSELLDTYIKESAELKAKQMEKINFNVYGKETA